MAITAGGFVLSAGAATAMVLVGTSDSSPCRDNTSGSATEGTKPSPPSPLPPTTWASRRCYRLHRACRLRHPDLRDKARMRHGGIRCSPHKRNNCSSTTNSINSGVTQPPDRPTMLTLSLTLTLT